METSEIVEALQRGTEVTERVLLRVEELEQLVAADRPRRLIDLAQAELARAVEEARDLWDRRERGLADEAASCEDPDVQRAWREFRMLLATSARRAVEASALIAGRLAVADDALAALGVHREYGHDGSVRRDDRCLSRPALWA